MKCVVMDYSGGEVRVITVSDTYDTEDVEDMLVSQYGYRLKDIYFMLCNELVLKVE